MKELRVIFKLYNNLLRERREATGLTACGFALFAKVQPAEYCEYERLVRNPLTQDRVTRALTWKKNALKIASALHVRPEDCWPDSLKRLSARTAEVRLDVEDAYALTAPRARSALDQLVDREANRGLAHALDLLDERTRNILIAIANGSDRAAEAGRYMISRERVRTLISTGLRRLRSSLEREDWPDPTIAKADSRRTGYTADEWLLINERHRAASLRREEAAADTVAHDLVARREAHDVWWASNFTFRDVSKLPGGGIK
jgi:hypothetical protein